MGRGAQFRGRLLVDAAEFEAQRGGQAEITVVTVVEGDLGADSGAGQPDLPLFLVLTVSPVEAVT
jgi:hypothetical protein